VDLKTAMILFYWFCVLAWIIFARYIPTAFFAFSFFPMLTILKGGNVTPILALLAITPAGALLGGLCKPYLFALCAFHAGLLALKIHRGERPGWSWWTSVPKGNADLLGLYSRLFAPR
jgi:hypothetical protein